MSQFRARWAAAVMAVAAMACAGCPGLPEGFESRRLSIGGTLRTYELFAPAVRPPDQPLPLVIALHRFTETGADMARMTRFHELAARDGFIVAFPDGLQRRFNSFPAGFPDDAAFIRAVAADVAGRHPVDPRRVYLAGASNGGFLAHRLACEAADLFAAIAVVMGAMPADLETSCAPESPVPIAIIHGTADPIVPYDSAWLFAGPGRNYSVLPVPEAVAYWAALNGCAPEPVIEVASPAEPGSGISVVRETYTGPAEGAEVLHYRVDGGGHTWPGGGGRLYGGLVGPQSREFDASEAIWTFFARHSLPD